MTEVLIHYILPNVLLFGGIFAFCKGIEAIVWQNIEYITHWN